MNIKILLLLALTLLATFSTIAMVAATPSIDTPDTLSAGETAPIVTGGGGVEPTGDPVDDPTAPD